jgi:O-antigen/teichoic acid export membrane protein
MSIKFLGPSFILFIDTLVVAAGGWFFWLILSKLSSSHDIGQATTIFSLALLACTFIQLGIEYPLLRRATSEGMRSLGGSLLIIGAISLLSIPAVLFAVSNIYNHSLDYLSGIAVGIIVVQSLGYAARFYLLGLSKAKTVFAIDVVGTIVKFITGILLISFGLGPIGILAAFLSNALVGLTCFIIVAVKNRLTRHLGMIITRAIAHAHDKKYFTELLYESILNTPSKLSVIVIFSLSVILLALLGVQSQDVAIFYMAIQISIVAGGLVGSMAYMVIPASADSKTDLSTGSIRIGNYNSCINISPKYFFGHYRI